MFREDCQYRAAFLTDMADALEGLPVESIPGRAAVLAGMEAPSAVLRRMRLYRKNFS
jgi:hypothetical protein